jgi:3-isopropylmalate/(R)-2-methylmalate dehydratase small subunit
MKRHRKGANARIEIDLVAQTVTSSDGDVYTFEVDSFKKALPYEWIDDIGLTMERSHPSTHMRQLSAERPWV